MREPDIVHSGLSRSVSEDGLKLCIKIYRPEVVDPEGTSTVWDEQFATDQDPLMRSSR